MFGTLASVLACAGFVAGCGGSGYTAAESSPSSSSAAPTATAPAPATPNASTALGSYAASDPANTLETLRGYDQFPKGRAVKIFVDPTVKPEPVATTPVTSTPITSVPVTTTTPTTTTGGTSSSGSAAATSTPTPVATQYVASLDTSGEVANARVGDQVPASSPQFTVKAITATKVTLKLNSGSLPGGGTEVEIAVGESITLSNPTTGASFVVKVTGITPGV
jgi:hypothetical protein